MGPAAVAVLGAALSGGLAAIHARGLVHRDLKPGNIILADDGPRIIDFGVARSAEASTGLTDTGNLAGTLTFRSPEQIRGEKVGARSDIFSLGSVLAYAANGRGPFSADTMPGVMYRIMSQDPDLGGLAEPVRGIVRACLAKAPCDRPALEDVTACLASQDQIQDLPATERPMASLPHSAPPAWGGSISGAGLNEGAGGGGTSFARSRSAAGGATFTAAAGSVTRASTSVFPAPTVPGPAAPESLTVDSRAPGLKARGFSVLGPKAPDLLMSELLAPAVSVPRKKRRLLAALFTRISRRRLRPGEARGWSG
jgi:serine/threonine protein kinase